MILQYWLVLGNYQLSRWLLYGDFFFGQNLTVIENHVQGFDKTPPVVLDDDGDLMFYVISSII